MWSLIVLVVVALPPLALIFKQLFYLDLVRRIMITLAFTQMLYYLGISLSQYGGDDGMRIKTRIQFPGIDLADPVQFYYFVLAFLLVFAYLTARIVNSRFGMVLRAAKSNDALSRTIGLSPYPYRLAAFVIAGAMCGVAGAMLVNHTAYLTPDFMHWTRSGEIMFMVILGGMATAMGPVFGAFGLLLVEDLLAGWTQHWQVTRGPLLASGRTATLWRNVSRGIAMRLPRACVRR